MYLVSVFDDQPVIEASLGGRIDLVEMKTFAEEVEELFEEWNGESFYLLLDYSKASHFDASMKAVLEGLKEKAFEWGAAKIYSVPQEDTELEEHMSSRIQQVLEGREEFLAFAHQAQFVPLPAQRISLAA
jgi:hypothetical protein